MKHYCTVPMDIKRDEYGKPHYVHCGKSATHSVIGSDWFVCKIHKLTADRDKWPTKELEENFNGQASSSRCGGVEEVASV